MATKTPSKGKKAAAGPDKGKASAPKKTRATKAAPVESPKKEDSTTGRAARGRGHRQRRRGRGRRRRGGGRGRRRRRKKKKDPAKAAEAAPATPPRSRPPGWPAARGGSLATMRRKWSRPAGLTPEAKAKINELVAKGMPLQDALRAAAAWETFVAPVREEPAKLVQGRSVDGGGHGGHGHAGRSPGRRSSQRGGARRR